LSLLVVGSCCEGGAVGFKCAGAGVVVYVRADVLTEPRGWSMCVSYSVLSTFALLVGAFVVCKNSGFGGCTSIAGLLSQVWVFVVVS
jgi:hypothetical protein